MHDAQLREHGGSPGVRNADLLESALARPRSKFHYAEADLATLAAAYAFGFVKNHAYVDGNKRSAFMAAVVFLGLNDLELDAPEPEVVDVMNRLADGRLSEPKFAEWLRERTRRS